ncbi:hypothetical protein K3495_g8244 [Podosphaera aphanis]|nr:hypothetical protein K3495_g8244 [Podosphaera aphanis]
MSTLSEITTKEAWAEYSSTTPPSTLQIIYFKAAWAEPCKQMTTVLETLASLCPVTEPLSTSWVSIDAEEVMDVSDAFNVTAVPYVVLRRGAEILEKLSGTDAHKVRIAIEKHASAASTPASTATTVPSLALSNGTNATESQKPAPPPAPQDAPAVPTPAQDDETKTKEELFKRLASLVKATPVMLFMKGTPSAPQCGFSRQIVALLRESGIKYGFFNILADEEVRQGLKEFADWPTYPQLWIKGELVGGLDILKEELANDPDFLKSSSETSDSVPEIATAPS